MSQSAAHSLPVMFDGRDLLAQVDGDRALFGAVLGAFRQEWPRRAADATESLAARDAESARRALHALSGMLLQLRAPPAALVVSVERMVKLGELERACEAWPSAKLALQELDGEIGALLERT